MALQDKTSSFFDLVPETLKLLELDSENAVYAMEKRLHPQFLFCHHQPRHLLLAMCLPHAIFYPNLLSFQPSGSSSNFLSNQTYLYTTQAYVLYLKSNPLTQTFLAEHHLLAPLFNSHLHLNNCPSNSHYWQIKSRTAEVKHHAQHHRPFLKHLTPIVLKPSAHQNHPRTLAAADTPGLPQIGEMRLSRR